MFPYMHGGATGMGLKDSWGTTTTSTTTASKAADIMWSRWPMTDTLRLHPLTKECLWACRAVDIMGFIRDAIRVGACRGMVGFDDCDSGSD